MRVLHFREISPKYISKYIILMSSRNPVKHMSRYLMCCRCMFKETVLVIIILLLSSTYRDIDTLLFSVATGKSKPNFADDHDSARVSMVVTRTCYTAKQKTSAAWLSLLKIARGEHFHVFLNHPVHGRSFRQGAVLVGDLSVNGSYSVTAWLTLQTSHGS